MANIDSIKLKNIINQIARKQIDAGIIFNYREILAVIKYSEKDKENFLNAKKSLDGLIFNNGDNCFCLPVYQYNKLKMELNDFENFHKRYSQILLDYIIKNDSLIDENFNYIYYGYMNSEIASKLNGDNYE